MAGAPTSVGNGSAPPRAASALTLLAVISATAAVLGWVIASQPELYRSVLALGIVSVLGIAALRWPSPAILATLLFLPLLGLVRRLLIESTGWPQADPLLLIGPVLALILFTKAYVMDSRPLATDPLSKLVLAFLALAAIGVFNPFGGGIEAGLIALTLTAIPLIWFFVGRALPDRATIAQLQYGTALLGTGVAIYGICQTEIGFPSWDVEWTKVGGYAALQVEGEVRGFGTMASFSEYAFYLGAGMAIGFAALLHRSSWPLVVLPILAAGVLLSSVRAVMVLGLLAFVVMMGLRAKRPRTALPLIAAAAIATYLAAAPGLAEISSRSGNPLITRQLEGIARPFDEQSSTLNAHLELISRGVSQGFRNPVGGGTSASVKAERLNLRTAGTEFDFSNAFLAFGLPGGLLYLTIAVVVLVSASRRYVRSRDPLVLGAVGLAVVTLGYWLVGQHYALTPLLWLILGWATRPAADRPARGDTAQPQRPPHPPGRARLVSGAPEPRVG